MRLTSKQKFTLILPQTKIKVGWHDSFRDGWRKCEAEPQPLEYFYLKISSQLIVGNKKSNFFMYI